MLEVILLPVGLLVGGAIGIYIGGIRGRGALSGQVSGLQASLEEVRAHSASRESELAEVRRALEAEKVASADVRARLESSMEHFAEQRKQFEKMDFRLKETFAALSSEALKGNNESFIKAAEQNMKPLREQLERYEKQIKELEKTRAEAYGGLNKHLTHMEQGREKLSRETQQLVAALRQPGAKGKWGEVSLRRVIELSGMTEHCDFEEQLTLSKEGGGQQRPDMVVHLPGGRSIVLDSKVNATAYLDAVGTTNEAEQKRHLARYATDVRNTMRTLGAKAYWKSFDPAPEFVVMFMPGEAFFAAAVSQDPGLLADGVENNVLIASPTTLIALLLAVRHGWRQQQMAENAERIAAAGRELYDRMCTFVDHLNAVRVGIEKAAEAYNSALGNWERRTLPSARRLKDLGAAEPGKELADLTTANTRMRQALPVDSESESLPREFS